MAAPFSSQALMEEAVKTPNVVEATNKPGLYNKLENLKKRWVPHCPGEGLRCGRNPSHAPLAGQDGESPRLWVNTSPSSECELSGHILPRRPQSGPSASEEALTAEIINYTLSYLGTPTRSGAGREQVWKI